MKRFVVRLFVFVAIIFVADVAIGYVLRYATNHISVGGQGRDNYIANVAKEDIMIFGSSRAVHHYNAQMIEDSLGLSCYNCGQDGNGIILDYGRLLMVSERKMPKTILVDINPSFDLMENDNHKYLGWLKLHYEKAEVRPIFDLVDQTERIKMMSQLYRYNSVFLQNLFVFLTGISNDSGVKGFRPTKGAFDKMKVAVGHSLDDNYSFDSKKIDFLRKFIEYSEGVDLRFIVSPIWYGMNPAEFEPVRRMCEEKRIPFYDFSNDKKYVHQDEYFKDGSHLNDFGADEFTRDLIALLRKDAKDRSIIDYE